MDDGTVDLIIVSVVYGATFGMLVLACVGGKVSEIRHYRRIRERESRFLEQPAVTSRSLEDPRPVLYAVVAQGSVVVSVDHFRRFLASFRKLFGGELRTHSTMIDRGRREAILRMKESHPDADLYLNCRLETATISNQPERPRGRVEIFAYSTAIKFSG